MIKINITYTWVQTIHTSDTNTNSLSQDYTHPDDHNTSTSLTPGFKPFKHQTLTPTVFLMITHTQMITTHQHHLHLSSNHQALTPTVFLKTTQTQMITTHQHHLHLCSNYSNVRH